MMRLIISLLLYNYLINLNMFFLLKSIETSVKEAMLHEKEVELLI